MNMSAKTVVNIGRRRKEVPDESIIKNELLAGVILTDGHISKLVNDNRNSQFSL